MSEQMPAMQSGGTAVPQATRHTQALTRSRPATGDVDSRYAGGISLAAALGGTLLSVDRGRRL